MHEGDTLADRLAFGLGVADIDSKGDLCYLTLRRVGRIGALNDGVETAAAFL
jgi:hypothetical protein